MDVAVASVVENAVALVATAWPLPVAAPVAGERVSAAGLAVRRQVAAQAVRRAGLVEQGRGDAPVEIVVPAVQAPALEVVAPVAIASAVGPADVRKWGQVLAAVANETQPKQAVVALVAVKRAAVAVAQDAAAVALVAAASLDRHKSPSRPNLLGRSLRT